MEKEKSLVEEAIIQIKNLEEVVAENAKGILHSTMKEEINQLVKESLTEQDEEDEVEDVDAETEDAEMEGDESDMDDMDDEADNLEVDDEEGFEDMGDEEPVIDLTGEEDTDEVLRVFQLMGPEDEIIVQKDGSGNINLKDKKNNKEYMIVGESEEEYNFDESELYEFEDEEEFDFSEEGDADDDDVKSIIDKVFANEQYDEEDESYEMDETDEMVYEIEMEDEEEDESYELDESDDLVYEIEMEDEEEDESYELDEEYEEEDEEYDLDSVMESKSFKPKGRVGKVKKVDFKSNTVGGFNEKKKEAFGKGTKAVGTGSGKKGFTYKDGENLDGEFKIKPKGKKTETKEAARTYGNGSKSGRGLRKGITPNRNLNLESVNGEEIKILREKNEEYRKALNVFRDKLNEVAVFNSNLAYATRLFTEHTTTKQEKVNILKRFDSVETIKESKNLYHSIKNELTNTKSQPMNESIERTINSTPSTGSAANLIESKTYENPQFLRMKDLMTKLR